MKKNRNISGSNQFMEIEEVIYIFDNKLNLIK